MSDCSKGCEICCFSSSCRPGHLRWLHRHYLTNPPPRRLDQTAGLFTRGGISADWPHNSSGSSVFPWQPCKEDQGKKETQTNPGHHILPCFTPLPVLLFWVRRGCIAWNIWYTLLKNDHLCASKLRFHLVNSLRKDTTIIDVQWKVNVLFCRL